MIWTAPRLLLAWSVVVAGFGLLAGLLLAAGPSFAWERPLAAMPAWPLAAGMIAAGVLFIAVWPLVTATLQLPPADRRRVLVLVLAAGAALRLALLPSTPAFEDDWHRYLWDGAVTAHGLNPYAKPPAAALAAGADDGTLQRLAAQAGVVLERINHPQLKSIYPPVAQAAFAVAYHLQPFGLYGWRAVCLAGEAATVLLLLALLRATGRSPLWVALYWLNPLIIKELVNSAHMEAVVTPLVLAALLLAVRGHHLAGLAVLGLAIGAKLWPVLLVPLLLRPLLAERLRLLAGAALVAAALLLTALPPLLGGLDASSGFLAYARHWQTASALLAALLAAAGWLAALLGLAAEWPGLAVRAGLGLVMLAIALAVAARPLRDAGDLLGRAGSVTLALLLLSPAQFPWYLAWALPLLPVRPLWCLMAATATMPLYYVGFHYLAIERYEVFRGVWIWCMWLPVWAALALDLAAGRLGPAAPATAIDTGD